VLGSAKNITNQVNVENQISLIINNIEECIYSIKICKKKKELIYISPHIKKITGLNPKEFEKEGLSGTIRKRIHPEDIVIVDNIIKELYNYKKNHHTSIYRFKPKGSEEYKWLNEELSTKFDEKNNLIEIYTVLKDITKEKQQQEKLIESEKRFNLLSNATNEVILIHEKGKIIDVNNAVTKIFGYKREELIGKNATIFSAKQSVEKVRNSILSNYNKAYEAFGQRKDGSIFYGEVLSKAMNFNGKVIKIVTIKDISERKIAELHLKENQEKYRNLFSKNLAGVFITENSKIIECNNAFAKIFGYSSRVEMMGMDAYKLYFTKADRDNYIKDLKKYKKLTNYRIKHTRKDGSEIWILTNVTLYNKNRIEGTLIEVTEEIKKEELTRQKFRAKIAEESNKILQKEIEERKIAENKLIENQKYTNSIINNSLDIISAADIKGKIIEFNTAATKAYGYSQNEILNRGTSILYANKEDFIKVSKQLKNTGKFVGEIINKTKSGELFVSFLSASLLYNADGEVIGTMGVSRDITSFKEAEKQLIESEEKYRDLFENASDLIQSVNNKGKVLYVNSAWKKTLGYTENEIINQSIFKFIAKESQNHCKTIFKEILGIKDKKSQRIIFSFNTKNGEKITVQGDVSLKLLDGKVHSSRSILRNITEESKQNKKQEIYNNIAKIITEKESSEELYEEIRLELGKVMDTSVFGISYVIDANSVAFPYSYDYTEGGRIFLDKRVKVKGLNEYLLKQKKALILNKKDIQKLINENKIVLLGKLCESLVAVPLKTKNKIVGLIYTQSYKNKNEYTKNELEILEFISGALALAVQRKYDESLIFEQSARLQSIIENSSHLFWTYNQSLGLTSFNDNFYNYIKNTYGRTAKINNVDHKKVVRASEIKDHPFWDEKYNEAYKGISQQFIVKKQTIKNELIVKEVFLNPIYNEDGTITEVSGIAHDITEKTEGEEKLKASLKEKEILLQEVHHRVKNNLQVISSILNLQSSYVKDANTLNILKESQNRIKSMAFIHESLYQTNDFSKINFSDYVITLSKNLVHSYGILDNLVLLNLDIKKVSLNLDLSIPCGLIINELVSNSLKYAFKGKKRGLITIKLEDNNGEIILEVADNGTGLPQNINYRETESLGLQLVVTLVEQINGTIKLDNKKGTKYLIKFKNK